MRLWILAIVAGAGVMLQVVLFPHLRLFGVKPDLVLVLATFTGFLRGPSAGGIIGLLGGLLEDLVVGRAIGMNALAQMITGYLAGLGKDRLFEDSRVVAVMLIISATFVREGIYFLLAWSFGFGVSSGFLIRAIVIPTAFYNALVGALTYRRLVELEWRLRNRGRGFPLL